MASSTSSIPAASGYPQYSGNLITPQYAQTMIEEYWCGSAIVDMLDSTYIDQLVTCGDRITVQRQPRVYIHDYTKDGVMQLDTLESSSITLTIDRAHYYSFKIDQVDEHQMCNFNPFLQSAMTDAARSMRAVVDCTVLAEIYLDAAPFNRGAQAGRQTLSYDLGAVGAPRQVTAANILDVLNDVASVMTESCVPEEGRWIAVPPKWMNLLRSADLKSVSFHGISQGTSVCGKLPECIGGFEIFVSNHLSAGVDPVTNQPIFNIIAGHRSAAVFAMQMEKARAGIEDIRTWDHGYQGLMTWGWGTIHEDGLVHLYANLA